MLRRSIKVLQDGKEKFYKAFIERYPPTRMKCDIYYVIVINTEKSLGEPSIDISNPVDDCLCTPCCCFSSQKCHDVTMM